MVKIKVLVIKPSGAYEVRQIDNTLHSLSGILDGGYLEALTINRFHSVIYLDEDGKAKGLANNPLATTFVRRLGVGISHDDFIVGTIIVCGEYNGVEVNIPENVINIFQEMLKTL